jgi:hypothetical protein
VTELQITDALAVTAEIAVALAGFAGLIVALRNRGLASWAGNELIRLRFMLVIACSTFFAALVPYLLARLISPGSLWFVSGLILGSGLLALLILTIFEAWPIRAQLSTFWLTLYEIGTLASCATVYLGALELLGLDNIGTYFFGLLWLLFYSTSLFVRLILNPPRSETEDDDKAA